MPPQVLSKDTGFGESSHVSSYLSLNDAFRSKIVENLAVVNYDTNNLHLAPYDWRLSYYNLEERDGYFSKLKTTIEGFKYVLDSSLSIALTEITQETARKEDSDCCTFHGIDGLLISPFKVNYSQLFQIVLVTDYLPLAHVAVC